ncbi:MAG: hypothetical protein ACP5VR_05565 [Acidimicrobiales bacterium]
MRAIPRPKFPEEQLLDLVLYVPLGLAMTVVQAVPELARKGRSRIEPQVRVAKVLGQMAVKQGYRQVNKQVAKLAKRPLANLKPTSGRFTAAESSHGPGHNGPSGPTGTASGEPSAGAGSSSVGQPHGEAIRASDLAIPSYDSLAAHQVVQRLAGLSRDEIAAVRDYEQATRGRRTIITRAEQLLS